MKSRIEIKLQAKEAAANQRTVCILILLVMVAIGVVAGMFMWIPFLGFLVYAALLIGMPVLAVGCVWAFTRVYRREQVQVQDIFMPFGNFARNLGGMLWMGLWIFLWALLLYIPGIIKMFEYMLTPFLLADYPNLRPKEALKISKRMTYGHKLDLFVMQLSFIGWHLLSALTFGILEIVYVGPYYGASMAGCYEELRVRALRDGIVAESELM